MNAEGLGWSRLEVLFDRARRLRGSERRDLLASVEARDPELARELGSLLEAGESAGRFFRSLGESLFSGNEDDDPLRQIDPLYGTRVGPYRIDTLVGRGGMGVVYRALHGELNEIHALKFLPGHSAASPEIRRRFIAESKLSSRVAHPNVGEIYDVAETEDGRLYLAMPFYDGISLKKRLRSGRMGPDQALDWFGQACLGLAAVHEAGIIHRDITPGNLLRTTDGVVKVLDFGLAKLSDVTMGTGNRPLGTIEYMSPEMLLGRTVDHRTDIWSLGVVLFEMLWGARPFPGRTILEQRAGIVRGKPLVVPPLPEGVDRSLVGLVRRLLSFEPGDRPRLADLTAPVPD